MGLTNLKNYVEQKRKEYEEWQEEGRAKGLPRSMPFEEENLVWAIGDYLSMKGEFTEEDVEYLKELGFVPEDFIEED